MSSRYSSCFAFSSPNMRSRSTCEKPMIALSGVRSSCDMLARNSDLCSARRLELAVEAVELVVHPVDVRGQRAELVAVGDVDVPREVARGDRGQPGVDPLDRPDHRPGEHEPEQQRERDRPRRDADEQVPLARVRARVLRDERRRSRGRRVGELRGDLVEVAGEPVGLVAERSLLVVRRAAGSPLDDLAA